MKNNNILICSYPHKTFYSSKEINKIISRSIKYPLKIKKYKIFQMVEKECQIFLKVINLKK